MKSIGGTPGYKCTAAKGKPGKSKGNDKGHGKPKAAMGDNSWRQLILINIKLLGIKSFLAVLDDSLTWPMAKL